jgi:diphthine-ammonia ligase
MHFVALVSGGKDSIYSFCKLMDEGHIPVALIHIYSAEEYSDSYMYQTVGSEAAVIIGKCLNFPLYSFKSICNAKNTDLVYSECSNDEVEDL